LWGFIQSAIVGLGLLLSPDVAVLDDIPIPRVEVIYAQKEEVKEKSVVQTYKELSEPYSAIVRELGLYIIETESEWNPKAQNPDSTAKGLFQFLDQTWNENCFGDPFNPEHNIECGLELLSKNQYWRWQSSQNEWIDNVSTSTRNHVLQNCQCVTFLRSKGVKLPQAPVNAEDLEPNSRPFVGAVALFYYPQGGGHAGLITDIGWLGFWVSESNFNKCKRTERFISWNDKFLKGFYWRG